MIIAAIVSAVALTLAILAIIAAAIGWEWAVVMTVGAMVVLAVAAHETAGGVEK